MCKMDFIMKVIFIVVEVIEGEILQNSASLLII